MFMTAQYNLLYKLYWSRLGWHIAIQYVL